MKVVISDRWKAAPDELAKFGGETVNMFRFMPTEKRQTWFYIIAFGKTPGVRSQFALWWGKHILEHARYRPGVYGKVFEPSLDIWNYYWREVKGVDKKHESH